MKSFSINCEQKCLIPYMLLFYLACRELFSSSVSSLSSYLFSVLLKKYISYFFALAMSFCIVYLCKTMIVMFWFLFLIAAYCFEHKASGGKCMFSGVGICGVQFLKVYCSYPLHRLMTIF